MSIFHVEEMQVICGTQNKDYGAFKTCLHSSHKKMRLFPLPWNKVSGLRYFLLMNRIFIGTA